MPTLLSIVFFIFILIVFFVRKVIRHQKKNTSLSLQNEPFESGIISQTPIHQSIDIRFYLMAMLWMVFYLALFFLFLWALIAQTKTGILIGAMIGFLSFLGVGFFYLWKKGVLEWE
jgi:NADH-quinone oxidoreductase subunit A